MSIQFLWLISQATYNWGAQANVGFLLISHEHTYEMYKILWNIPGYGFWDGMMVPLIPSSSTTRDQGRGSTLERDSFLVHPGGKGNWRSIPWGWHGDGFMAWPRESKTRKRYGTNGDIYRSILLTIYLSICLSVYLSIYLPESERTNLCILLVITTAITITNRDRHHHHHHHRHHHGQQQHQYINNNPISRYSHSYLIYAHNWNPCHSHGVCSYNAINLWFVVAVNSIFCKIIKSPGICTYN